MITYSIIQKSQLEGALRLDAEYYQPEYLNLISKLKTQKSKPISELVNDIRYGLYVEPEYLEKGVNFIRALNLLNFWIDGEILKIDERKVPPAYRLKAGDVLIVRSGANTGCVGLVYPRFEGATFGSYTIRLRFNKINPFFAAIFLNTKYGLLQTQRLQTGMAQPNLNIPNIKEIKIPLFSEKIQNEIEKICLEIEKEREKSEDFYSQAEDLLLKGLGLKDFKVEDDLFYVVNLSKVNSAHRADAEYFQPKYEKIFNYLKCPVKPLEKITEFLNHAKQPPYIDNGEIPIITQKHLGRAFLNLEAIADPETKFTNEEWLKKYPQYQLKAGDVLYYSVGAYIGKTNIVLEDLKATAASFITIIRTTKEINPIYLTVVLNSIIGQLQSEKWQSATAQQDIYPKDIVEL
jgi:restriction endonuclease S subunit